jgi:ArsR family transcriptional regulator
MRFIRSEKIRPQRNRTSILKKMKEAWRLIIFIVILQYIIKFEIVNMGISKSDFFTEEQNEMANLMKALGHPARIAIIEFLLEKESCICGDIVNELPLSQPTISQHLKELKTVNVIKGSVEGNTICYCLNLETLAKIQNYVQQTISKKINNQANNCC